MIKAYREDSPGYHINKRYKWTSAASLNFLPSFGTSRSISKSVVNSDLCVLFPYQADQNALDYNEPASDMLEARAYY